MIEKLMNEYMTNAATAAAVDYSDKKSVRQFNSSSDRMRAIVDEVATLGEKAVLMFTSLLDNEPAASWAAVHLVEIAELDSPTLSRCFSRVEQDKNDAEAKGALADVMIKEAWLEKWKAKKVSAKH